MILMFQRLKKKWIMAVLSGSVLFQTTACIENSIAIGATASVVTAGGVIYIVSQILGD